MPRFKRYEFERMAERTLAEFEEFQPEYLAVDTETTGFTWKDEPFGVSVAFAGPAWKELRTGWFETLDVPACRVLAGELLNSHASRGGKFIFFNAKFDARMLDNHGYLAYGTYHYEDAAPMLALLQQRGGRKLKEGARLYLEVETREEEVLKAVRAKLGIGRDHGYYPLPREVIVPYALKDALWTHQLYDELLKRMKPSLLQIYLEKELPLIHTVLRMEQDGVRVIPELVKEEIRTSDAIIAREKEWLEENVGMPIGKGDKKIRVEVGLYKNGNKKYKTEAVPEFNPNSSDQIVALLNARGHKIDSSRKAVLLRLRNEPFVAHLLAYRAEMKLLNTYLWPILEESVEQEDGTFVVHSNFNPYATETGRFSSSEAGE